MKKNKINLLKRAMILSLWSIIALTFFNSCEDKVYIFEKKYELSNQAWTYADSLKFSVEIADTSAIYNLYLDLEHQTNYKKQNLYTRIHTKFPQGQRLKEQLSLELADKTGKWNGNCSGEWCVLRIPLQTEAFFNQAGSYQFTIEQFMRDNSIKGIKSVALAIEDTKKRR